jgi:2-haloalkanoic acid dehalogenase type II
VEGVRAISFDCYGTLVDWESGIRQAFRELFADAPDKVSEEQLLELFAKHESRLEAEIPLVPYFDVLRGVAKAVALDIGAEVDDTQAEKFAASVGDWPLFDDVLPALRALHDEYTLAILSNVDRRCFSATEKQFDGLIDIVCIAEETGAYKPAPEAFHALDQRLANLGIPTAALLHVAQSLYHDHEPAGKLGIRSCWIDRRHDQQGWGAVPSPTGTVEPDYRARDLHGLVELLRGAD